MTIEQVIERRMLTAEFQPVVRLDIGEIVGFEAFARGPVGSSLALPKALFAEAEAVGMAGELDFVAHEVIDRMIEQSPLKADLTFFVNMHPLLFDAVRSHGPDSETVQRMRELAQRARMVVEVSQPQLLADPIRALTALAGARMWGVRVGVDNVDASLEALPLLALLQPDAIKLTPGVADGRPAALMDALACQLEHGGGVLLAQGIEREDQAATARQTGATFGQGYLFGPPVTLPSAERCTPLLLPVTHEPPNPQDTPFDVIDGGREPWIVDAATLRGMIRHLEGSVEADRKPFAMISANPLAGTSLASPNPARQTNLRRRAGFVLVFTTDTVLAAGQAANVLLLDERDSLTQESALVVVTPTTAAVLAARPQPAEPGERRGPEDEQVFECRLSRDRRTVIRAAQALLARCTDPRASAETSPRRYLGRAG